MGQMALSTAHPCCAQHIPSIAPCMAHPCAWHHVHRIPTHGTSPCMAHPCAAACPYVWRVTAAAPVAAGRGCCCPGCFSNKNKGSARSPALAPSPLAARPGGPWRLPELIHRALQASGVWCPSAWGPMGVPEPPNTADHGHTSAARTAQAAGGAHQPSLPRRRRHLRHLCCRGVPRASRHPPQTGADLASPALHPAGAPYKPGSARRGHRQPGGRLRAAPRRSAGIT